MGYARHNPDAMRNRRPLAFGIIDAGMNMVDNPFGEDMGEDEMDLEKEGEE